MQGHSAFSEREIDCAVGFVRRLKLAHGAVVACPVSRLQVQFRLGYGRACGLAEELVTRDVWEIVTLPSGMRGARLK